MWHWCKNERWYFIVMHHDYLLAPIFLFCLARCCFRCGYRGASSSSSSLTTATTHQPSGALLAAGACGDHHGRGARAGWLVWSAHTTPHHKARSNHHSTSRRSTTSASLSARGCEQKHMVRFCFPVTHYSYSYCTVVG